MYASQSGSIQGSYVQAKIQALKSYKKHLEKKFSNLHIEALISKIVELSAKNLSPIKVDLPLVATFRR